MFFFQLSGRAVTAGQQKSSKTVTARITARPDMTKSAHSKLQVMGVAPPLSSVIVERHHPITQVSNLIFHRDLTGRSWKVLFVSFFQLPTGQATAAKFPHSSQQGHSSAAGRSSSRAQAGTCHVHSIKVVEWPDEWVDLLIYSEHLNIPKSFNWLY